MQPIVAQFKRTIWSEHAVNAQFERGVTIADIVDAFPDKPLEFEAYGGVFVSSRSGHGGGYVHRKYWHRIKPKEGTKVFISLVPHGGGSGGSTGKQIFSIVAAVALMVLTAGSATFLAPLAGLTGIPTGVLAGGIAIAGGIGLSLLNKPSVGRETPTASTSGVGSTGPTLGTAGIAQNPITAWAQVPCIKGYFRGSPPCLAKPYVLIDKTDQVAYVIVGYAGQYDISEILINDTAIDDFADGVIEYETRGGR